MQPPPATFKSSNRLNVVWNKTSALWLAQPVVISLSITADSRCTNLLSMSLLKCTGCKWGTQCSKFRTFSYLWSHPSLQDISIYLITSLQWCQWARKTLEPVLYFLFHEAPEISTGTALELYMYVHSRSHTPSRSIYIWYPVSTIIWFTRDVVWRSSTGCACNHNKAVTQSEVFCAG